MRNSRNYAHLFPVFSLHFYIACAVSLTLLAPYYGGNRSDRYLYISELEIDITGMDKSRLCDTDLILYLKQVSDTQESNCENFLERFII